ncbi:MAG: BamA/TamA family outer membrane protein, partial [Planctomycetaceae bacterium]|nr:BamA/TamA family outer membrane protein [Planctomycetaceae bacterium]
YPPSYRNTGNVLTQGPREGEFNIDLSQRHAQDPLARPTSDRAAQRSATADRGRPLSESFDPALQPQALPPGIASGVAPAAAGNPVAAPPPGATRVPSQVPPRNAYPVLNAAPAQTSNGLPPPPPPGGPLGAAQANAAVPLGGPAAQMARNPSPLGPPEPPTSANPDLAGKGLVPTGPMVVDVRVEGNETIKPERIRPHVKCRKGRPLDTLQVEEDVRRLLATRMFIAVRPKYIDVPGGVTVLFQVMERPALKYVKYQGSHLRDRTLAKQTGLKKGSIADPFAVEEARVKLEQFFRDRGHNKVRVTAAEGTNPGDQGAVFVVHEGPIPRVHKVDFINNTIASDARLRTQISSKKPWFRIPGVFRGWKGFADPEKINADVDTLVDYYRGLGFFNATVSREVVMDETQELADVTFVIKEGPRYSLRTVSFIGHSKFNEEELKEKLKLKPGDFFDRAKMQADVSAIEEKYGSKGYVFADIEASPRFDLEPGQLDLVFKVSEGRRCRVGQITVEVAGENPHTRRMAILNRLSFRPGDIMDIRKLRDSERRLQASGLFLYKPQEGKEPKITFSPPVAETENLVENPDEKPDRKVRGQSPDGEEPELVINLVYRDCKVPARETAPLAGDAAHGVPQWPAGLDVVAPATPVDVPRPVDLSPYVRALRVQQAAREATSAEAARGESLAVPAAASSRAEAAAPASTPRNNLPPGTIVRGQSPTDEPAARQTGASLNWRSPAVSAAGANPTTRPAAGGRTIVRGQDLGYSTSGGDTMPSFSMQSRAPARTAQAPPAYSAPSSLPPARQVINPNGTPVQSPLVAQNPLSPPGGFAPGSPAAAPNGYGQFTPSASPPPPAWAVPNSPSSPLPATPVNQAAPPPAAQAPGTLPPPAGYSSPEEIFGPGPGDRNWLGGEEPPIDVPVRVLVEETQTGRLMLGVGVNSNAGLVGSAVIDEQNFDWTRVPRSWADVVNGTAFRGAGQHFRIEAMPGTQFQRYLVSFTEPYLFDTPVSFGVNGSYFVRQYLSWTEQRLGGRVNLGYQIAPDITLGGALRAESINISNIPNPSPTQLSSVLGNSALYTARVNLVQDTRDSAFLPTQGRRISLAFEQGFGDFSYPRGEIEASQYFRLRQRADGSGRHVLRVAGQFGISGSDTPIFENFFAGGYSSIRGFMFRGASPIEMGVQVGGRLMLLGGLEYMFPLTADDMLRGVVFCDTGTVEQDINITSADYRVAIGAGLRIQVPMMGPAPIALDFAVPVNKADTDQTQVLSVFVGVQY